MAGQAKLRGSYAERVKQALALKDILKAKFSRKPAKQKIYPNSKAPAVMVCGTCHHEIKQGIEEFPVSGIKDLESAYMACCPKCKNHSFAVNGSDAAVQIFVERMQEITEQSPVWNVQPRG